MKFNLLKHSIKNTPSWEELQQLGPQEQKSWFRNYKEWERREKFVNEYAWAVPTKEAIDKIKDFIQGKTILEIASGNGLWSALMKKSGINVVATGIFTEQYHKDQDHVNDNLFDKVENIDSDNAMNKYRDMDYVLMLCWPLYNEPLAYNALMNYDGDKLIYIGEGDGGCTGCDNFHKLLSSDFEHAERIQIPRWTGIYDAMHFFVRKNDVYS